VLGLVATAPKNIDPTGQQFAFVSAVTHSPLSLRTVSPLCSGYFILNSVLWLNYSLLTQE
jgi:hypothetical protein